jgi:hypothetical protein
LQEPSRFHIATARRLIDHECQQSPSTFASRLFEKLAPPLGAVIGRRGVEVLLVRCAAVCAAKAGIKNDATTAARVIAQLQGERSVERAEILFATLFALLTAIIGNDLTSSILAEAWPTLDTGFDADG